jgi:hypothetical protein
VGYAGAGGAASPFPAFPASCALGVSERYVVLMWGLSRVAWGQVLGELPPKQVVDLACELSELQAGLYHDYCRSAEVRGRA